MGSSFNEGDKNTRTATVVVAAADSLHPEQADLVCTGLNDQEVINAAINNLSGVTTNKKILILDGTIHQSNPIIPTDNTEIEIIGTLKMDAATTSDLSENAASGQSIVTVVDASEFFIGQWVAVCDDDRLEHYGSRYGDSAAITSISGNVVTLNTTFIYDYTTISNAFLSSAGSNILIESVDNVTIHGSGTIDGNKANQSAVAPLNDNASEETRSMCGISMYAVTNVTIRDILVKDSRLHGIFARWTCNNIVIHDVEIDSPKEKCIGCYGRWADLSGNVRNFIVYDCYVHDAEYEDGITIYHHSSDVFIYDNRIENNPRYGIRMGAGIRGVGRVTGNIIKGVNPAVLGWGISDISSHISNIIMNNRIDDNWYYQMEITYPAIKMCRNNIGWVTENSGTDLIAAGSTTKVVTHGLAVTPVAGDITIVPIGAWGAVTQFHISAYSSTTFTVTVDQVPGGAGFPFAWKAIVL